MQEEAAQDNVRKMAINQRCETRAHKCYEYKLL
jgi:hypothetical protein